MQQHILDYIRKALSPENRKAWDGDSNAPYRVQIAFAEVGACQGHEAGFWFELKIPRQVDNALGMSIIETKSTKQEAVAMLKEIIAELERE